MGLLIVDYDVQWQKVQTVGIVLVITYAIWFVTLFVAILVGYRMRPQTPESQHAAEGSGGNSRI